MLENHVLGRTALGWISGRFIFRNGMKKITSGLCSKAGFGGEYLNSVAKVLG
jgi:hypothetical protein